MDGPLYVAFNTTTLWHFDAGEQGPSTSSFRGTATAASPELINTSLWNMGSGSGPTGRPGMTLKGEAHGTAVNSRAEIASSF